MLHSMFQLCFKFKDFMFQIHLNWNVFETPLKRIGEIPKCFTPVNFPLE